MTGPLHPTNSYTLSLLHRLRLLGRHGLCLPGLPTNAGASTVTCGESGRLKKSAKFIWANPVQQYTRAVGSMREHLTLYILTQHKYYGHGCLGDVFINSLSVRIREESNHESTVQTTARYILVSSSDSQRIIPHHLQSQTVS